MNDEHLLRVLITSILRCIQNMFDKFRLFFFAIGGKVRVWDFMAACIKMRNSDATELRIPDEGTS